MGSTGGSAPPSRSALRRTRSCGGVWFGWSGEISEAERRTPSIQRHKALTVATLDLTPPAPVHVVEMR